MSPDHRLDDQSVANKDSLNECEVLEKETAYHDRGGLDGVDDEEVRSRMAKQAAFDRKLLWKMDLIVVPLIAMLYLLVFIDRVNIGNARVAGMQRDLQMNDHQYQTAVTLTYVLYIVAELPSNLMLRKVGPKILLPGLCVCWGIVTTLQCLVKTYHGLLVARLFLGLAEGGLFPGINLYLSMFYKRDELQLRIAMFYSGAALSGAFSGLLAAAISKMNGIGGLTGWQWIFCLEGLFTVVFGVFAFWAMPNSPRQVQTFTEEQAKRSEERLQLEATFPASEKITLAGVLSVYQSLHLWLMFVIMFCGGVTVFGLAFFMPSIVLGFGYNPIQTQLMTVPPFAVAFVITLLTAYIADRYRKRGTAALVTMLLGLIGVIMFYRGRTNRVRYTALFFLVTGTYANVPCLLAWVPNNTAAHTRRAVAIATAFCCTNSGGIVSTWIFPTSDAPYYPFASKFILAMIVITLVAVVAEMAVLNRRNKQKDDPEYRERLLRDVQHLDFPQQMVKLGDAHPDYKYII